MQIDPTPLPTRIATLFRHDRNIRQHLLELRELLADDVDIWTGGEGVRRLRKLPAGVTKFNSLEKLPLPAEAPGETHELRKETA